jgi:hypothetical protein
VLDVCTYIIGWRRGGDRFTPFSFFIYTFWATWYQVCSFWGREPCDYLYCFNLSRSLFLSPSARAPCVSTPSVTREPMLFVGLHAWQLYMWTTSVQLGQLKHGLLAGPRLTYIQSGGVCSAAVVLQWCLGETPDRLGKSGLYRGRFASDLDGPGERSPVSSCLIRGRMLSCIKTTGALWSRHGVLRALIMGICYSNVSPNLGWRLILTWLSLLDYHFLASTLDSSFNSFESY